ncbi:MAG: MmgE/PrpD family protein [Micrococcaceae bacterium]
MEKTLTAVLTNHLATADFDSLPPETVDRAKTRVLDAVGLIAAGVRAEGSSSVIDLVTNWGGRPEATVLTSSARIPAMHAALVNAVLMRSYDFEPVGADHAGGSQIPSHITGTTVSVALAVAEAWNRSGRDLITALVYGDDLAARLGHATGFDVYGGGDNTGTINALGGVATAGLLMRQDATTLHHGLGLVINQVSGTIDNINDKSLAFKLPIALSARNAVFSAELAAAGFGGPVDPIGGRFGFLSQWSSSPQTEKITDGLGRDFYADAVIKPWPTCRASQASLDATVQLVEAYGIAPDDVDRIEVHVNPQTKAGFVGQEFTVGVCPEVSGAFSIRFAVATALIHGTVGLEHMNGGYMRDPTLQQMLENIEIVDSLPRGQSRTAEVEVTLHSGGSHRVRVDQVLGDIHFAPLDRGRIESKFRGNIAWNGALDDSSADRLLELIDDLENLDDLSELVRLLAKQPGHR